MKGQNAVAAQEFLAGAMTVVKKEATKIAKHNTKQLVMWGGFLLLTILVYFFCSSGDFSFLLTFAALWRCFGLGLLNYKVWTGMNVRSISMKTLVLYATCFTFRLFSILRHQGKLAIIARDRCKSALMILIFTFTALFSVYIQVTSPSTRQGTGCTTL